MKIESQSKLFIGFRCDTADELLKEMKESVNMKLLSITLKGEDSYDPLTFAPAKHPFYTATFAKQS